MIWEGYWGVEVGAKLAWLMTSYSVNTVVVWYQGIIGYELTLVLDAVPYGDS